MKHVASNMAGVVIEFLVQPGDHISVDDDVVMLESMKMQIPVQTTVSGTVKALKVNAGDFVDDGDILIDVE
ncbi:MAG TPA: biotin/lipoyl-containing protein [Ktedonosporobacter sp.]|nr:biotin/lipoyl-containing protein [Ktedonosporobacter sp.]